MWAQIQISRNLAVMYDGGGVFARSAKKPWPNVLRCTEITSG
jgi:hypothetical protein